MIQVNLIPGGKKKRKKTAKRGSGSSFSLPSLKGLPTDRWVVGSSLVTLLAVAGGAFLFLGLQSEEEETAVAVEAAAQDSARYAEIIQEVEGLLARRDSIIQRVDIIQGIDEGRYVWPHVLDEVARALPDYTWLTGIVQSGPPPNLQASVMGQAGNNFAVAEFMTRLTESPFIQSVDLVSSSQAVAGQGTGAQQLVYDFSLEVYFQAPPPDVLETVPLFDEGPAPSPGT
ncbi:MAG: PilN domain-containing protein [Gemmatimonadota bacterium]